MLSPRYYVSTDATFWKILVVTLFVKGAEAVGFGVNFHATHDWKNLPLKLPVVS